MSIFIPNTTDYIISFVIGILALFLAAMIAKSLRISALSSMGLFLAGLVLAYVRYLLTADVGFSDAHYYYESSLNDDLAFGFGSNMLFILTSIFSSSGIGFIPTNIAYSILSCLAMAFLYSAYLAATVGRQHTVITLIFLVVVMPSVGFWGGAIGKDAFAVLGTALFCWALIGGKIKIWPLIFGTFLMMIVRPHIGILMLVAIGASSVFAKDIAARFRLPLLVGVASVFFIILPSLLLYVGLDAEFLTEGILETLDDRQDAFADSGSFISLVDMPLALRPFSYLFRPFPFEANSATQLVASLQNIVFLVFFTVVVLSNFGRRSWTLNFGAMAMIGFSLLALVLLANLTPNLGIAFRQKQMFVPAMMLALIFYYVRGGEIRKNRNFNFSKTQNHSNPIIIQ